ncbi:MAG: Vgb family protein [Acidimicrobiales bacterium]
MRRGAGLLALALVAGACTSGPDGAATSESAPTTAPSTTTAANVPSGDAPTVAVTPLLPAPAPGATVTYYPVVAGSRPHDVAPAPDGSVWYTAHAGQVAVHDPATGSWREWKLPGTRPHAYAVYVDEKDRVWLSDFGANALVIFDPSTEQFRSFASDAPNASVRQILGRPGEVWGAESGADRLVVVRGA